MTHTFKVGDRGKTRGGDDYRVLCTDADGEYPVVAQVLSARNWAVRTFTKEGKFALGDDHILDLMPPKATSTVWIPLLRNPETGKGFTACTFDTREEALDRGHDVIAVKQVTITEGEGMDE